MPRASATTAHGKQNPASSDAESAESSRATRAADRTRLADIVPQILKLEQERDFLQSRLAAYTYPVLTLPTEIVSEIFIHFLPPYPKPASIIGRLSPLLLGQICREWREIALANPALWRAVGVYFRKKRLAQQLSVLETYLKRSGFSPLSIRLEGSPSSAAPLSQIMSSHWARCEHLTLDLLPRRAIPSIAGPLPFLRSLTTLSSFPDTMLFNTAPLLRRVTIGVYSRDLFYILPWSRLTAIIVDMLTPSHCLNILSGTVNLTYCRFQKIWSWDGAEDMRLGDVTVPHLETLILGHAIHNNPQGGFLSQLNLPALRTLRVSEALIQPDPVATLSSLVSRSQCSLQELWIAVAFLPSTTYRTAMPSVHSLTVDKNIDLPFFDKADLDKADLEDCSDHDEASEESESEGGLDV
ncbi:hypothetical protein DFH09DRAFT_1363723 [Mycena vulgaris]|nr:hypothetical protein DFH09DRAFT_1363723 [Mycena vulgaris]